jgi:hypothetical protein
MAFGICLLCFPSSLRGQQAKFQTAGGSRVRVLAEQLRWRTESGRKRYEAEKTELTHNVLSEIDHYINERFVPGSATVEQVQSGLNHLLGYTKGLGIHNVAFFANLPKGDFLIVGVELWRGGPAINEDYICFRAYADLGGKFVNVANTGNLSQSDSYLVGLHAQALQPPQITGQFWFIAWANVPPQSPYTIVIRLYTFDGKRFRKVWEPQNIIATNIDNAIQVGPSDAITINRMRSWKTSTIVHEQYVISEKGPKKTKEWKSRRE